MSRLTERAQTSITVGGIEYPLNPSYRNALLTWDAMEAAATGELSTLAAAFASCEIMLGVDIDDWDEPDINEALREIAEYLSKYSRNSEKNDPRPPVLSITQDAAYIHDAFQLLGVDLDGEDITYPRFMSLMRVLPDKSPLCRIVHLRQQRRDGKLTKEERREIDRVWGWDVIYLRDGRQSKNAADDFNTVRELQNKLRAEKGLPPI